MSIKAMQKRVFDDPKIEVVWYTQAVEAVGEDRLTGVRVANAKTGVESVITASGLFYAIGMLPSLVFLFLLFFLALSVPLLLYSISPSFISFRRTHVLQDTYPTLHF